LADEEIRYARIGVSLGLVSAKPGELIIDEKLMIPKLRDHFLVLVGQKTSAELAANEVKEELKKSIAKFINEGLDPELGRVSEVYFTEFIIQ
jgi:flagellar basal body-associated protein FliL